MTPEYAVHGQFSVKSNIFSFDISVGHSEWTKKQLLSKWRECGEPSKLCKYYQF